MGGKSQPQVQCLEAEPSAIASVLDLDARIAGAFAEDAKSDDDRRVLGDVVTAAKEAEAEAEEARARARTRWPPT